MSNILFVLYHDFGANSAVHVHNFANNLVALGHSAAAVVPRDDDLGRALGEQHYTVQHFSKVDGEWSRFFENGRPPDIVHAWTPRENVRLFCDQLRQLCSFALVVHLEDNEELILEANLGAPFEKLRAMDVLEVPLNLSHPRRYREFLKAADAATVIMDRLAEFVPKDIPSLVLWPGADNKLFFPRPKDDAFLEGLGIPAENLVVCYTGNVHSANAREVRSLYVAAALLNRQGIPTTLLRAGNDYCPFLGPDDTWAREISVSLGYISHVEVPSILGLADYLIQPGTEGAFNDYRLPAKLPEFFAMGKPVLLPGTNVGRFVHHGEHAWVLPRVDAYNIVNALKTLRTDSSMTRRLASGALAFAQRHFDWKKNAIQLASFYNEVLETRRNPAIARAG
jgi:glycosyltransferase involved in cell wall biosynthesis